MELQQVDRQLALDDLDVADDRFRSIAGEAEDVSGEDGGAGVLPLQQHLPVFGDLVLLLARAQQAVGIDALEADEHPRHPARPAFSMKCGRRWHIVSTWMMNLMFSFSRSRISMRRSKMLSQSVLRAKLSSVMKKRLIPCARFRRMICSTSSADRRRDLRPCTLIMVQNEHWNGQPRPASKLVRRPPVRLMREAGRMGMVAPARPGRSSMKLYMGCSVPWKASRRTAAKRPSLSPANRETPDVHRFLQLRCDFRQHGKAPRDVESAQAYLHAGRAEDAGHIHGSRILIRLHADQRHQPAAGRAGAVRSAPAARAYSFRRRRRSRSRRPRRARAVLCTPAPGRSSPPAYSKGWRSAAIG